MTNIPKNANLILSIKKLHYLTAVNLTAIQSNAHSVAHPSLWYKCKIPKKKSVRFEKVNASSWSV